jgi:epidermal growth factor receptor substrate 15
MPDKGTDLSFFENQTKQAVAPQPVRLTSEEKRLYGQLFRTADSEQLGVITGPVAVEFFKKSGLGPALLAEV